MEDKDRASTKGTKKTHPRERANFISKILFSWTFPMFVKGFKKDLTEDDLCGVLKAHESRRVGDRLEEVWEQEKNNHRNPSLWRVLIKVYGRELAAFAILLILIELIAKMAQPLLIGKLMTYYSPNQNLVSKNEACLYSGLIVLAGLTEVVVSHSYVFGLQHLGMKMRVACCSLIYRKALKLNKTALEATTVGQIVNLLSNDINRFDLAAIFFHDMWMAPIETCVIMYLLYTNLGASALTGTVILLLFIPFQCKMTIALKTDQRVRLMNEIVSGIQVIKMYTWEKPFSKLVAKARKLEIREVKKAGYLRALNFSFMMFMNRAAVFLCIVTHVLTGNQLDASYLFVVVPFYENLRYAISMYLPLGVTYMAECKVSVKRIQTFLTSEEVISDDVIVTSNKKNSTSDKSRSKHEHESSPDETIGIYMDDISASWVTSSPDPTLRNINFSIGSKELVAIVGTVGSGKSTLLHVILKELNLLKGRLETTGKISYASQEPWLFSGSIKQNILFGQEMDQKRYQEIVQVCALERDFSLFPYGDRTIVGERGVMLSGGQKARINLARAVYKNADIYLLDDPLSAVDAHVGKQLFDDCIQGFLKNKCTVLVTHQLQYLRTVDRIYLLQNGKMQTSGTYQDLQSSSEKYLKLLQDDEKEADDNIDTVQSIKSLDKLDLPLEIKEHQGIGSMSRKNHLNYLRAGGKWYICSLVFSFFILTQSGASGCDYFLKFWVNLEQERVENYQNTTSKEDIFKLNFFTPHNCLYLYTCFIVFIIIMTLTRSLSFFKFCMKASTNLHNNMFSKIVYTSMRFFNTNSAGRILNRFSKDMGAIDESLPQIQLDTLQIGLTAIAISIVIATITPWILIPTTVLFALFYCYKIIYLSTSRDLKRIEGVTRSPVLSYVTDSLRGLTTIRASEAQETLKMEFDHRQDVHTSAFYFFTGCSRAFGFLLDLHCVFYTALVTFSFIFIGTETYSGNVGLAITQAIALTTILQFGMRQWSEMENQMTCVERVVEYTEIPPEPDQEIKKPPKNWPIEGNVAFRNVSMKYSNDEPYVLKNLTFSIKAREKVGIVGRTGAGKSSLISALFRLVNVEGKIVIDEIDTKEISLNCLRSKISIIPQEPVLFSGTLRKNLDPFEEYDDSQLWSALEQVELKSQISELPSGLQCVVSEGGSNFSVGQRQLLCLARAVIRSNKILVLDEATANVDQHTDELIQKTIRKKFIDCTVLTIAHRLHTVMDSDKILVMDAGHAAEFGPPYELLQNENGILFGLVMQTGKTMAENLKEIAKTNNKSIMA